MAKLFLEVVSPERLMFAALIDAVALPASEGDMTVLPGHEPAISSLNPGFIVVTDTEGHSHTTFVAGGFVEITGTRVLILAERALPLLDLTARHIDEEILHHETVRDATHDERRRHEATFMIDRLQQVRAAMAFSAAH
jgi:F-type H+-transporting ATPase subunit epsilon